MRPDVAGRASSSGGSQRGEESPLPEVHITDQWVVPAAAFADPAVLAAAAEWVIAHDMELPFHTGDGECATGVRLRDRVIEWERNRGEEFMGHA